MNTLLPNSSKKKINKRSIRKSNIIDEPLNKTVKLDANNANLESGNKMDIDESNIIHEQPDASNPIPILPVSDMAPKNPNIEIKDGSNQPQESKTSEDGSNPQESKTSEDGSIQPDGSEPKTFENGSIQPDGSEPKTSENGSNQPQEPKTSENGSEPQEPKTSENGSDNKNLVLNKPYTEFYLNSGYAFRNNRKEQYYAKNNEKNEIYYMSSDGELIYAHKSIKVDNCNYRVEFPAVNSDGSAKYIYNRGIPKYPENVDTSEIIFPKDEKLDEEIYLKNLNGESVYPVNKLGHQFYRKNVNNDEVPIPQNQYAILSDGKEIYPKRSNGDEYYLTSVDGKMEIGACMFLDDATFIYYYARKKNGDEIYPRMFLEVGPSFTKQLEEMKNR